MSYRPEKIISGGQTGADMGGLLAAKDLGIKTGGWAPKGFRTENGPNFALRTEFKLVAAQSDSYSYRTRLNVAESDFTVIFGDITSTGSKVTRQCCISDSVPYLINPDAEELHEYARMIEAEVVNIAGNRASKDATIEERVRMIVREAFHG